MTTYSSFAYKTLSSFGMRFQCSNDIFLWSKVFLWSFDYDFFKTLMMKSHSLTFYIDNFKKASLSEHALLILLPLHLTELKYWENPVFLNPQWRSMWSMIFNYVTEKKGLSPSWCGSVDWTPACEPKGCLFHSQAGHLPGFRARPLVGAHGR